MSEQDMMGVAWALYSKNGQKILHGKASTAPTSTPLETEALALLIAIRKVKKLDYNNIIFVGEIIKLSFDNIQRVQKARRKKAWCLIEIATIV